MSRLRRTLTLSNYRVERKLAKFREIERSTPMLPVTCEIHYKNGAIGTCEFIYNQTKKRIESFKIGDYEPTGFFIYKFTLDRTGGLHTFNCYAVETMNDLEKTDYILYYMDPRVKQFLKDRTFVNYDHRIEFKPEFAPKSKDVTLVYNLPIAYLVKGYLQEQANEIEIYKQLKRSRTLRFSDEVSTRIITARGEESTTTPVEVEGDSIESSSESEESQEVESTSEEATETTPAPEASTEDAPTPDVAPVETPEVTPAPVPTETETPEVTSEITPETTPEATTEALPEDTPETPAPAPESSPITKDKTSEALAESFQLLGQALWKLLIVLGMFLSQNSTIFGIFFKFLLKLIILLLAYLLQCLYIGLNSNNSKVDELADDDDKKSTKQSTISFNF
ncbi:Zonadhesin [Wickerhamomyces ciferrii]|uniref:Zonadhesin n=1 Tax=Wickerhamomyces ciferrii (strain ATCC 14091 / BCRC 22168 / CBS 111 / JCM 3599 / NBRC 0793 / NRRL Y-1031 F-60-10) TaxID=1206466 RepID=K0KLT9_WICCF|nr:Zonadhesin [Wickerhamomyces ciferrii]CCH42093.1 Zonadhesin [Wickerhamomyces ciferrii]